MVIFCLGMQSSGSTWLYNVVREILTVARVDHVAFRAESYENFADTRAVESENAVLRAHNVESFLLRILSLTDVKAVLSYRDPRDAIASFIQRFGDYGAKFPRICNDAVRGLAALLSASRRLQSLSFFYEDGFTQDAMTIRHLATFLGIDLPAEMVQSIFDRYSVETVKSLMASIDQLPADRLYIDGTQNAMDRVTSFHRTHISDGRVGKWRDAFDDETADALTETFGDYARLLSARATGGGLRAEHNPDVATLSTVTVTFSSRLFAPMDNPDNFQRFLNCAEVNGSLGIRCLELIYLPEGTWDFTFNAPDLRNVEIRFCQAGEVCRVQHAEFGVLTFRYLNRMHDHPFDLHVTYDAMASDVAASAPPPRVVLKAKLDTSSLAVNQSQPDPV